MRPPEFLSVFSAAGMSPQPHSASRSVPQSPLPEVARTVEHDMVNALNCDMHNSIMEVTAYFALQ